MEYVARLNDKTQNDLTLEDQDGQPIEGKEAIAELVKEWKTDFERQITYKKRYKDTDKESDDKERRLPRHATHMLLSAGDCEPTAKNYERLERAVRDMLQRELADKGYDYIFVVHKDTQHPHAHVIIKNRQREIGQDMRRKLRLNPNDLLHLRRQFAHELQRNGIEQIATRSVDAPGRCLEALKNRIEGARKNLTWYQAKMQEPEWNKETTTDLQKYANNLQKEITRIKELTKESKLSRADRKALEKDYKALMNEIGALRVGKEADLARQSVDRFKDRAEALLKTAPKIENAPSNTSGPTAIAQSATAIDKADLPKTETAIGAIAQDVAPLEAPAQSATPIDKAAPNKDWSSVLTLDQNKERLAIDEKLSALKERISAAEILDRQTKILEMRRIQRLIKKLEPQIKKAPYDWELRKEQFKQVGRLRVDLRKLRREPKPPQKALNEYGLDLNFNHAAAVKVGEARTAREQIKEANAGIVVIERQILEAQRVIKDLSEAKIGDKEKKQHLKDINAIRDRFLEGYAAHIKDAAKLVENAIAADKTLKEMPPSVKRKERELLHKTIESYNATLKKSQRFADTQLSGFFKIAVNREINKQRRETERSFSFGMGL
jgi:hypothetical protein